MQIYLLVGALQINSEIINCNSTFLKGSKFALKTSNNVRQLVAFDKKKNSTVKNVILCHTVTPSEEFGCLWAIMKFTLFGSQNLKVLKVTISYNLV